MDIATEANTLYDVGIRSEGSSMEPSGTYLKSGVAGPQVQFTDLIDGNYEGVVRRKNTITGATGAWFITIGRDANAPDLINPVIQNITNTTLELKVTLPTGVTKWEYKKENGQWNEATTTTVTIPSLAANTLHNFYVRPVVGPLIKGKVVKLSALTTGSTGDATDIQRIEEICFNAYHTNTVIRFTIKNALIAIGEKYQIKLKNEVIAEHTVVSGDTFTTVISSLFNQVSGIHHTIVVTGTAASFDYETYSKSFVDGQFYQCGIIDETPDYTFVTI